MLELHHLSITLPRRGIVLDDVSARIEPGRVTAVVGATGAGTSILLRHLADRAPNGAQSRGRTLWKQRPLPPANPHGPLTVADWALPPLGVATWLRGLTAQVREAAEAIRVEAFLDQRIHQLPLDIRARLHLAALRHLPDADLVLADPVATAADGRDRRAIAEQLRRRAERGAVVLWAEHDLDLVWEHADRIIELHNGRIVYDGNPAGWVPVSVPEPTLMTLARAHSLDPAACRDAQSTAQRLADAGHSPGPLPPSPTAPLGDTLHLTQHGLGDGLELTLGTRECLGVVDLDGRAEPIARRLVHSLPNGSLLTSHLPAEATVGQIAASWERRHRLPIGSIVATLPRLRGFDRLLNHGTGDVAQLRAALALGPGHPLWFPHPQAGLDTRAARNLAAALAAGCPGPRIVTSRDTEFLVRACHRILVVSDGAAVACGSPQAVAPLLPEPPLVAQATGSAHHTRLAELLGVGA